MQSIPIDVIRARAILRDWRIRCQSRVYDWPTGFHQPVTFPYRPGESRQSAQMRVVSASLWHRRAGSPRENWRISTHRIGTGIQFEWLPPLSSEAAE